MFLFSKVFAGRSLVFSILLSFGLTAAGCGGGGGGGAGYSKSENANLSALELSTGDLNQTFNPDVTSYSASVSRDTGCIYITPTAEDDNYDKIEVSANGWPMERVTSGNASTCFSLNLGDNSIGVLVTAEDGITTKIYNVTVKRANTNANLSSLALSAGTLDPSFSSSITDYKASVAYSAVSSGQMTVTPAAEDNYYKKIEVRVNNGSWDNLYSGYSCYIDPISGNNLIEIKVTAEDGTTSKIYTISVNYGWIHQSYLKASNTSGGDNFGSSVAVSGDTLVVSAPGEDSNTTAIINNTDLNSTNNDGDNNGAVYVFVRSGSTWWRQAYLKGPNTKPFNRFGDSVAISGNTIVVGVPNEDSNTTAIINGSDLSSTNHRGYLTGAAYVFVRNYSTWTHQAYLKAPRNSWYDCFGNSVAISGDTIVVGADLESSNTTAIINGSDLSSTNVDGSANGAAYVFVRNGTTWTHQAYLKAPNTTSNDLFGSSVAISGNTIVVGAYGEDSNTTAIINGSNLSSTNNYGDANGAAYVFVRTGATWTHQAYLKAPNTSDEDYFGSSVAIYGDTVVVGASNEDSRTTEIINGSDLTNTYNNGSDNGAAYVFVRYGTTWTHQAYLKAPNTSNEDYFGSSVAIYGDKVVVGAGSEDSNTTAIINGSDFSSANDSGFDNGAVYVFVRNGVTWTHQAYLKAPNTSNEDYFGSSVAISGDTIAVGACYEDSNTNAIINGSDLSPANDSGYDNGAAYVFVR